jgi:hypothetical protein
VIGIKVLSGKIENQLLTGNFLSIGFDKSMNFLSLGCILDHHPSE